ncbi:SDR family oxidoreductase [Lichenibacterium dinghuense]|uniref:SDR family oxidoreductase n=1 Tax=Lichenibacterium dinghuense TaxID=2895977 RepID=UPI001F0115AA|nr:SDR family oxidoreductase [Lichenibacterium sp. 6Y81]
MSLKPLAEQTVVVTGASSGIGLATARMAVERGARVVLVARDAAVLEAEAARMAERGGKAAVAVADVGERAAVEAAVAKAVEAFGGFDTWVNVAGITIYGELWRVEERDHERLMRTNFWGTVNGSLAAVEHLRDKGGAVVNVGSVASDLAFPLQGMYCASKHAVKGFTDALRMELLQEGAPVGVTLVKPASIDTPLPHRARNYMDREPTLPPPLYRPEEVAEAILHAAVHPRREIYVGGAAAALSGLKAAAPNAYDLLAPAISTFERRGERPRDPEGALHGPKNGGQVRGDYPGPVLRSAYTRAGLNPVATTLLATGASVAAALVLGRRRR